MRVAFVSIPCFPSAVEVWRNPSLADRPLIVGDAEQPKRVLDCSAQASEQRVGYGMTLRAAMAACPDAVVVPPDPVLYRSLWENVLHGLTTLSPEVEDEEWGRAYLNVTGLEKHYRDEATLAVEIVATVHASDGLKAAAGIASGKFPAFAAGSLLAQGEVRVIARGDEAAFLAPLSVNLLPAEREVISRLRLLGLDRLGEVAALTLPELQSQFGFEGGELWRLANGIDNEQLRARPSRELLDESLRFEMPVGGIEVMVASAGQLFSRLQPSLRGRAVREIVLQAELTSGRGWERRMVLREAVSETGRLLYLLRTTLQNAPPPMAVHSLTLGLSGLTGESGKQLSLGDRGRLQSQLEESIRQLKTRYGYSPIFRCTDVEPWSVLPEERQILVESDG